MSYISKTSPYLLYSLKYNKQKTRKFSVRKDCYYVLSFFVSGKIFKKVILSKNKVHIVIELLEKFFIGYEPTKNRFMFNIQEYEFKNNTPTRFGFSKTEDRGKYAHEDINLSFFIAELEKHRIFLR